MSLSDSIKGLFGKVMGNRKSRVDQGGPAVSAEFCLDGLTVLDLKALAKERGLSKYSRLNKSQLLTLLE